MATPLRTLKVLNVEDSERDAALITRHLSKSYDIISHRVDTAELMRAALEESDWDVILCDYSMPKFSAVEALSVVKEMDLDLPFIIVSGTVGEAVAVEVMRAGAHDYLMKDNLTRLAPTIERELQESGNRRARRKAEQALHETNETLQALIKASPLAIVALDMERKVKLWNPAAEVLFGWTESEVIGKVLPTIPSEDMPTQLEFRESFLKQGRTLSTLESRRMRKDGSMVEVTASFAPLTDVRGEIVGTVGVIADITERKQAELALKASHQRLEQTLHELKRKNDEVSRMTQQLWQTSKLATMGELAAGIAHELNNPLATLALRAESLVHQLKDDDPKRRVVEVIGQEVERMGRLVSNLLQFSRRSHQQISTIDVSDEIENSLELIEYHLKSHKIKVLREYDANLPTVQADRQQLHQVFLNLLTNATDAMPQGGKLIVRVQRAQMEDGREGVQIEFVDAGTGIFPHDLDHIWEPFYTTKPEGKGTGLGLAICRRVVEEHHGTISIDSQYGQGTTVRIVLPATNGKSE